jgi:hypothetical protein
MNRTWKWLNSNPTGICIQFGLALIVMVGGIFGYFSITACDSTNANSPSSCDDPGKLPPSQPPTNTHSSAWTSSTTIIKPDMEPSITNTGSLNPAPGSQAERKLSWSGNQPDRLTYHPPLGATDLVFTDPTKQPQAGGPPYFFNNPPKDIPAQFSFFPALPAGKPKWTVTETLQSTNATGAQSVTLETTLGSTVAEEKATISRIGITTSRNQRGLGAPVNALAMKRWYWVENVTMDATLCQQIVDWLQSSNTFVALQTPVNFPTGDPGSGYYQDPLLLVPDQARLQLLTKRIVPTDPPIVDLFTPILLEYRPERMTFAQNRLPAVAGQRWVSVGVSKTPKVVCPTDLNQPKWEFKISLPLDLFGNTGDVPLYFCQEGQNPPPIGQMVQNVRGRKSLAGTGGAIQADGITCIGPQPHSLATTFTIKFGNPAIAWGIKPPKEVKIFHELYVNGAPTLNFSIESQINGANWKLYKGSETAPDLNQPIVSSASFSQGVHFLWLVGTIPDGTASGSYNVVVSAEKAGDSAVKSSVTDLLWVDIWVPPPLPGEMTYNYLPLILQKQ